MAMLDKILAISGQPGLFKLLAHGHNSVIVESLQTGKRTTVTAAQRISALGDISMYTTEGDVSLSDVMLAAKKFLNGKPAPDPKKATNEELKAFMGEILPAWDSNRIYTSDIKRLASWYNMLEPLGLIAEEKTADENVTDDNKESDNRADGENQAGQETTESDGEAATAKEANETMAEASDKKGTAKKKKDTSKKEDAGKKEDDKKEAPTKGK